MAETFDFAAFPTLTNRRVVLREWKPEDAPELFVWRSDPEVQRFNSAPMREVAEAVDLIKELRAAYEAHLAIHWAVTLGDHRAIGLFGFNAWERFHRRAEIGYDLRRDCWGRGFATQALDAILRFGFTRMGLNRVEAQTIADNHASVRLLRRLGFQREGLRRAYSMEEDGSYHDGAIYGLLRTNYGRIDRAPQ
ncbi:GNAT family N-acetyltransferase [Microlunatus sp. Gsoil 973]|uniref:GNAT family N-acetyltransferase n=1 Tax=Microlunatus sp. Gsoil 973 TaxID=2672569 RepID=UPI0012B4F027|nr:GNAT family N-acetyltransferase [Microlunatus sp. Gsoil 973]QGN32830.1 GNAT family N-acetyltransferase [Microlunatus sp. Gsoil 973]